MPRRKDPPPIKQPITQPITVIGTRGVGSSKGFCSSYFLGVGITLHVNTQAGQMTDTVVCYTVIVL